MIRAFFLLVLMGFFQISFGQKINAKLDSKVYEQLLKTDPTEFIAVGKSLGLTTDFDSVSNTCFVKKKGILLSKSMNADTSAAAYVLHMMVSTLDKSNNKLILKSAKPVPGKANTWIDANYVYLEWNAENPVTKEMWYRVFIYKQRD
jgi:hypothetical protein